MQNCSADYEEETEEYYPSQPVLRSSRVYVPPTQRQTEPAPVPDNFACVIPVEDELEHTPLSPFCFDGTCPCHEDDEAIAVIYQAVQDGLLTPDEATDFVLGRLL